MIRKFLILMVFFLFCLTGGAFAAFRLSGATVSGAFVEILEVTGSPVYTVAAPAEADMIANAQRYLNSTGGQLTFNADSAGAINFSYGENQETPASGGGTIGPKTLLVRVWSGGTFGNGNYSYSQQFTLGSSMDGIRPIALTFTGPFTQGAPPAPGVTATQTGFDLSVRPTVSVTLNTTPLTGYEIVILSGGKYNYAVTGGEAINSDSTSVNLDSTRLTAGTSYTINAFARNGFGNGAVGTGTVVTTAVGAGDVRLNFNLILRSITGSSPAGINMFGMPFASGEVTGQPGAWFVGSTPIRTANNLVRAINAAADANVVSSFGRWNKDAQQVVGVMIRYSDAILNNINSTDAANLNAITLQQGEGYQVYASPLTDDTLTLTISNRTTP